MIYPAGGEVYHATFGLGRVVSVDRERHVVDFIQVGRRKVLGAFLASGTVEGILATNQRSAGSRRARPAAVRSDKVRHQPQIKAKEFIWRDPAAIPPRDWLFGRHYIREFVSGSAAPGGTGKSFLSQAEALSMISGAQLLEAKPHYPSLNVWYWNLEDPEVEIERRFAAARLHHDIDPGQCAGRLFVNSGRDTPLVIASKIRDEVIIAQPVVDDLVDEITRHGIDVVIVDPFISSHGVPENDNGGIDAVVKLWGRVASAGQCAIELVHHTKKMAGETMDDESFRGAKSLVDGLRAARILHPMTKDEAAQLGQEKERRRFFYTMPEKQSMAPPVSERTWHRLASVELPNGDNVGAIERWMPPDPFEDVTSRHLDQVQAMFRSGPFKESNQASDWGGYAVATVLKLDVGQGLKVQEQTAAQKSARARVRRILTTWRANGAIDVEERLDCRMTQSNEVPNCPT